MAFLHPKNLASRSDVPQRLQVVARALRDFLPDGVTVWLERTGDGDAAAAQLEFEGTRRSDTGDVEAYLVLLDPQAGIIVIETPTKARVSSTRRAAAPKRLSGLAALAGAFRNRMGRGQNENAEESDNPAGDPVEQDRIRLMITDRASQLRRRLDNKSISTLPVVEALALPSMQSHEAATLSARFGVSALAAEDFTAEALHPALRRVIGSRRQPLTQPEENTARATVNPTIVIDAEAPQMFTAPSPSNEHLIRVLDREQERLAHNLGNGYRLIRGVAGSGKTLVLTHRAMYMSRLLPKWRILVLCFNRPLRASLAAGLAGHHDNITVYNLDALAYKMVNDAGLDGADPRQATSGDSRQDTRYGRITRTEPQAGSASHTRRPDFDKRRRDALEIAQQLDDSQRYDMVLVDEAQDLDSVGLDLAWALLKSERRHFVMAMDSAQSTHRRRMTWNPPEITAQGRTTLLDINYRNTQQVLDLGLRVLLGGGSRQSAEPAARNPAGSRTRDTVLDDLNELVMPDTAVRSGVEPQLLACADLRAEAKAIAEKVEQLRNSGTAADDIVVLLGDKHKMQDDVTRRVPGTFTVEKQKRDQVASIQGKVRIASLSILKGLEFKHVIIGGANHIHVPGPDDAQSDDLKRRNLYVAITRATESVTIVYSGSGLMSELKSDSPALKRGSPVKPVHTAIHPQHDKTSERSEPHTPTNRTPSDRSRSSYRYDNTDLASRTSPGTPTKSQPDLDKTARTPPRTPPKANEEACYERLRQWRLERSRADGVPAYVVFNNKVMAELARRRPVTDRELLKVPGIGPRKLEVYGSDLKELLAEEL
ncbi:MAG: HRDC domain-containing protein [Acidimicrobiaceae bacterium]|nr:HRDC domain-containing protein [Acidimicrobiaceae bacterium]